MKKLPKRRKYLESIFSNHASPEDSQHLLQGPFGEVDNNINTLGLRSTHSKANSQAPREAETKMLTKRRYKACQVERQV